MKKIIVFFLLFLLPYLLFAQETLTIWTSSSPVQKAIISLTENFEKKNNIKVDVKVFDKTLMTKFKLEVMKGEGPDILVWAHDVIGELAKLNLIEEIDLPANLKNSFFPEAINAFTYKGKIYGYPYDLEAVGLIYNKNLIKNPPKTMEELARLGKLPPSKGVQYFLYDISNFYFSFPFFSISSRPIFLYENGKIDATNLNISSKESFEAAEFLKSLAPQIAPTTDDIGPIQKMKKGELAMTINGPWVLKELREAKIPYGVSQLPTFQGRPTHSLVGSHGFIIRKTSPQKALAKLFIENYLVSKEGIVALSKADPRTPASFDALKELSKKDPDLSAFMKMVKEGVLMPNVPEMSMIWAAMQMALKVILTGAQTPDVALSNAQKQLQNSLEKSKTSK